MVSDATVLRIKAAFVQSSPRLRILLERIIKKVKKIRTGTLCNSSAIM